MISFFVSGSFLSSSYRMHTLIHSKLRVSRLIRLSDQYEYTYANHPGNSLPSASTSNRIPIPLCSTRSTCVSFTSVAS